MRSFIDIANQPFYMTMMGAICFAATCGIMLSIKTWIITPFNSRKAVKYFRGGLISLVLFILFLSLSNDNQFNSVLLFIMLIFSAYLMIRSVYFGDINE